MIAVLRLGHRRGRDDRISTHVGLVARAFGAEKIIYSGEKDDKMLESVRDVVNRWGGPFEVSYNKSWRKVIKEFEGLKVHLTMYGLPYQENLGEIPEDMEEKNSDMLVIVGSQKVPSEVYELVDYNLAVNNQPHSEVAALGIFLHDFFGGKELNQNFEKAEIKLIPDEDGKKLEELD